MFRELNEEEVQDFKKWARDNYEPGSKISSIWHPVVQEECHTINAEIAVDMEALSRKDFDDFMASKHF